MSLSTLIGHCESFKSGVLVPIARKAFSHDTAVVIFRILAVTIVRSSPRSPFYNRISRNVKWVRVASKPIGVGKSSLVLRFVTNNFKPYSESTIGASFMSKMIMIETTPIKFQIWDTAGQEKYHSLAPMYYRGAGAAIIVYDITNRQSFKTLKDWVGELQQQGPPDIVIAIAGNKRDLEADREVEVSTARAYAEEIGAMFFETSAKDDTNVYNVFVELSKHLPEREPPPAPAKIDLSTSPSSSSSCC
ncbi:unnamed protein product [Phaeothamnion confervicola]